MVDPISSRLDSEAVAEQNATSWFERSIPAHTERPRTRPPGVVAKSDVDIGRVTRSASPVVDYSLVSALDRFEPFLRRGPAERYVPICPGSRSLRSASICVPGCLPSPMQAQCKHAERLDSRSPSRCSCKPATTRRSSRSVAPAVPHRRTLARRTITNAHRSDGASCATLRWSSWLRDRSRRSAR